jgi:hypothetical protein
LRGALATKQSRTKKKDWIASRSLAMTEKCKRSF